MTWEQFALSERTNHYFLLQNTVPTSIFLPFKFEEPDLNLTLERKKFLSVLVVGSIFRRKVPFVISFFLLVTVVAKTFSLAHFCCCGQVDVGEKAGREELRRKSSKFSTSKCKKKTEGVYSQGC